MRLHEGDLCNVSSSHDDVYAKFYAHCSVQMVVIIRMYFHVMPSTNDVFNDHYDYFTVCATNPCMNGGNCVPDSSQTLGYRCSCPTGYSGQFCTQGDTSLIDVVTLFSFKRMLLFSLYQKLVLYNNLH